MELAVKLMTIVLPESEMLMVEPVSSMEWLDELPLLALVLAVEDSGPAWDVLADELGGGAGDESSRSTPSSIGVRSRLLLRTAWTMSAGS